jgi:hypothetical protein
MDEPVVPPPALDKKDVAVFKEALKTSKVEEIENDTATYVKDVFDIVRNRASFLDAIEAEALSRISNLSDAQLIALVSNTAVNVNDAVNKALSPTAALLTEKQRTEAAKANAAAAAGNALASHGVFRDLNQKAPQDVLIGLKGLSDMLAAVSVAPREEDVEAT